MQSRAAQAMVAPPISIADPLAGRRLLDGITLDFGPADLLGRFFLKADAALRERGIEITFGTVDELVAVNKRNADSWRPLISVFDPAFGGIDASNSFVMLGKNRAGEVVATQAARLYSWTDTNFAEEARSLRLFYRDPDKQRLPDERVVVTAPSASEVLGRVVYSGGVWYRPDYRGGFLSTIMPRISRANAFSRWFSDLTITIMEQVLVDKGLAQRCGYTEVERGVQLINARPGSAACALLTMNRDKMLQDLTSFLQQIEPQIDHRIQDRAG